MSFRQTTLGGDVRTLTRRECEKYPGCNRDAEYLVTYTHYTKGEADAACCLGCKSEFAEWVRDEKIRELERNERWLTDDSERQ